MKFIWILCYFCWECSYIESARILGFFMVPSISHQKMFQPIWKELSLRGHEVTVVSPNILNDPSLRNLTEIDVSFSYEVFTRRKFISSITDQSDAFTNTMFMYDVFLEIILEQFEYEPVKQILNDKSRQFDVILAEGLHPIVHALGGRFKAPVVVVASIGVLLDTHEAIGNPTHPIIYPDFFQNEMLDDKYSLLQRISNVLYAIQYRLNYNWIYLPKLDRIAKKYFGEDLPYLGDLQKNLSLVIGNVNPVMHRVRANVPTFIEVSQMHISNKKALPKDLQTFLDSSPEGVIYFSLGTNVKSVSLSPELRETILQTLAALPYKVLWKWENDHLPNKPKNVVIRKWLPQQDILGHPNIKVFITQCGLQSVEEAISNEVPMVALPFLADQPINANKVEELGIAIRLDYRQLTKADFIKAILEVARGEKYKENIRKVHQLLIDQPMTGLEKAIWWIEYVIRNKGTQHLRSPVADTSLFQYYMMDVIAIFIFVTFMAIISTLKIIAFLGRSSTLKMKSN